MMFRLSFVQRTQMSPVRVTRILFILFAMGFWFLSFRCDGAQRRFTVADDIGLAYFGDPYSGQAEAVTFSPDGLYFVVDTERGILDRDRPESTLRVYRTKDVHEFLLHPVMTDEPSPCWIFSKSTYKDGPIITHIRWLRDSRGIAFLAKTGSGNSELFFAL